MVLPLLIGAGVSLAAKFFPLLVGKIGGARAEEVATEVVTTAASVAGMPLPKASELKDPGKLNELVTTITATIGKNELMREQLRFELEKLDAAEHERILQDRENARSYQIAVGSGGRIRGNIMLIGVSVGLVACIVTVVMPTFVSSSGDVIRLTEGQLALITTVAGALLKMLSDAFAFEFGSSRGSKEKDAQITDFKQALVQAGKERQDADKEIILSQNKTAAKTAQEVRREIIVSPQLAESAEPRPVQAKRDFVSDLQAGRV